MSSLKNLISAPRSMNKNAKSVTQMPKSPAGNGDGLATLRTAQAEINMLRLSVRRELDAARQMRAEAEKYRNMVETKARSEAQMMILNARQATKKEIAALRQEINHEIEKVLLELRQMLQEDLKTQRRFMDAARIRAMSPVIDDTQEDLKKEKEALGV